MTCWVEDKFLEFVFHRRNRFRFYVLPMQKCQNFSQILSGWAINVFKCLQRITSYQRVEVIDSVIFSQLVVDFEACLEKIINQLRLLLFPVKRGHCSGKWLWQLGNSVNVASKVCIIAIVCQLLKGQKIALLRSSQGGFTAELQFTCREGFFCLPKDVPREQYVISSWTPVTMP